MHSIDGSLTQQCRKTHLPNPNEIPTVATSKGHSQRQLHLGVRRFLKNQLSVLVFAILHSIFSLYIRLRQAFHIVSYQISSVLYYHHGTPEYIRRDVAGFSRKPKHLSAILSAEENQRPKADLNRMIDEAAELAAWCASAEIPMLSIYDKTGSHDDVCPQTLEESQHR